MSQIVTNSAINYINQNELKMIEMTEMYLGDKYARLLDNNYILENYNHEPEEEE